MCDTKIREKHRDIDHIGFSANEENSLSSPLAPSYELGFKHIFFVYFKVNFGDTPT